MGGKFLEEPLEEFQALLSAFLEAATQLARQVDQSLDSDGLLQA
jgi:hypothetical protein